MIDVYTDASLNKNGSKYGIGIFIIDQYERERNFNKGGLVKVLDKDLGKPNKKCSSISIIEAYAVYMALRYMNGTEQEGIVYTDSLSSVELIYNIVEGENKYMRKIIELCKKELENKKLEVRWIKGHCGVYGNEKSNVLAKVAMKGDKKHKKINW